MGWTQTLRGKEEEEEYGYIFEPDLTRIEIGREEIDEGKEKMPELPDKKMARFIRQPSKYRENWRNLWSQILKSQIFSNGSQRKLARSLPLWVAGPLKKTLNWYSVRLGKTGIERAEWFVEILKLFENGRITDRNAELVIRKMVEEKGEPEHIMKKHGLEKTESRGEIDKILKTVIEKNAAAVKDYKAGEKKAMDFLVGQVMRESKGRVDPKMARELIEKKIKGK